MEMINRIWLGMMFIGLVFGLCNGQGAALSEAVIDGSTQAVNLSIAMVGGMMFWMGLMEIVEKSNLTQILARGLGRILRPLFREVQHDEKAMSQISLNIAANMLGLGNAATPFGLCAMQTLQAHNPHPKTATCAQIMLICIDCSAVQFLPTSIMTLLAAAGSAAPTALVLPILAATSATTLTAVVACLMAHRNK